MTSRSFIIPSRSLPPPAIDDAAAGLPRLAGRASPPARRSRGLALVKAFMPHPFAASAATILSRVIGRSFMRTPMALKTALATAAGAGTLLASPMLFAPNGP